MKIIINIVYFLKNVWDILFLTREKKIAQILIKNSLTISSGESCTGGLISSRLTDISGSSAFIRENFVTYANDAKISLLGVKEDTIKKYGVVSEEVAKEMALGLIERYKCDIALTTTGIAGPTGATENKPVGMVCICAADKNMIKTCTFRAKSLLYRRMMKYVFSNKAFDFLIEFLNNNNHILK